MAFHTPHRRAAHEAGHVVVAGIVGWKIEFVTLRQHPTFQNLWGYVQYSRPLEKREDLERWAPTFLAGQFSEALLLGFAGPGASQDTATVLEQIRLHLGEGPESMRFFHTALHRANAIIQQHRQATAAIAEALLERESLSHDEVLSIINATAPPDSEYGE